MYYKCCVHNCASKRQDVKLHQFPASEIGLHKWLQCINSDRLRNLSIRELRNEFVCHKHFERRFISDKNRIHIDGYPSLFSEEEIRSGVPSVPFQARLIANVKFDHCYGRRRNHEDHTYSKASPSEATGSALDQAPLLRDLHNLLEQPNTSGSELVQQPVVKESQNLPEQPTVSGLSLERPPVLREIQNLLEPPSVSDLTRKKRNDPVLPSAPCRTTTGNERRATRQRRKRLIRKVADLPPYCRRIYNEYRRSMKQLDFMKRAKRAERFSKSQSFQKLASNVNPLAKKIIWMQIKQSNRKLKGRRFTNEEKTIALSIMKQSPKAYRFLQKIFILPSRNTLHKLTSTLNVQPGINDQIFDAIKDQVKNWNEKKRYCSIIFDEVSLEPGLDFDKNKDHLNGFVHLNTKTNDFADHALAFMLRGAIHKWQQPVAYYFCAGATKNEELRVILKMIINAVIDTGLLPVAVISDQGQSFQSALKALIEETRGDQIKAGKPIDDVITLKGHDLSIIFDPPHLIKGIRNNFLNKNMKFQGKLCKWADIVDVYKADCGHTEARLLHKLNDTHVIPEKINKMKVKTCTQVLSKTVAAALSYTSQYPHYPDGKEISATLKNTAAAVKFFDDLFDSCNGASLNYKQTRGKELRKAVTKSSRHHEFWKDAIEKLQNTKFIDERRGEISVPSIKNWVITLKSYMRLWQFFKAKKVKIMRPRYFNSDPIENFFGQVRAYNFRNNDPNCHSFISTFKSLLITRFIKFHSAGFNCEEDSGAQLIDIQKIFEPKQNTEPHTSTPPHNIIEYEHEQMQAQVRRERLNVHSRAYTAGWLVRKILRKINCENCSTDLTTPTEEPCHSWISEREYNAITKRRLFYPSEYAVRSFGVIVKESNEYLEKNPHLNSITEKIKGHILSKYSFDFLKCAVHKKVVLGLFLAITIKFAVYNWCSIINKILKGTDIHRLGKTLPLMQEKALKKYNKKLKNKRK